MNRRVADFLQNETRMEFERVYHLVDAHTILGYIHKESGKFKVYEGGLDRGDPGGLSL